MIEDLPLYTTWVMMRQRCNNPKATSYPWYGAKGIKVCDAWNDFETFVKDMGPKPTAEHTLDREDGSKDYEPSNCCWSLPKEQSLNRSSSRKVMYQGQERYLYELAAEHGVSSATVRDRLRRGWDLEKSLTPARPIKK